MQVDPGFSKLTPRLLSGTFRGFQLLKLRYDKLLSNFACFGFNCNLRHYTKGVEFTAKLAAQEVELEGARRAVSREKHGGLTLLPFLSSTPSRCCVPVTHAALCRVRSMAPHLSPSLPHRPYPPSQLGLTLIPTFSVQLKLPPVVYL